MAENIIDKFLLSFGISSKEARQGAQEVEDTVARTKGKVKQYGGEIEQMSKKAGESLAAVKREFLGLIGLSLTAAGIKSFVSSTVDAGNAISYTAKNLDMSAGKLNAWGQAAARAGGSYEDMISQLQESAQTVGKFPFEAPPAAYFQFGGRVSELRNAESYLLERSRILKKLSDEGMSRSRVQTIAGMMGIHGDKSFNFLVGGADQVQQSVAALAPLSRDYEEFAAKSEKMKTSIVDMGQRFDRVKVDVFLALEPVLKDVIGLFESLGNYIDAHKEDITAWIRSTATVIKDWAIKADEAAKAVGGWEVVLGALLALKVTSGLLSIASTLAGMAASVGVISGSGILAALGIVLTPTSTSSDDMLTPDRLKERFTPAQKTQTTSSQLKGFSPVAKGAAKEYLASLEKKYGLPEGVLDSLWNVESGRGANMLSNKGAKGHFQFMDDTAQEYGVKDPYNLHQSADGAARMLRDLMRHYGNNLDKSLAAYNWGQGNVDKYGIDSLPDETRKFVPNVEKGMKGGGTINFSGPVTIQTNATDSKEMMDGINNHVNNSWVPAQVDSGAF